MSTKHTIALNCFKLNGYPDWWHELQARKKRDFTGTDGSTGQAALVVAEPHLSLIPPTEFSQDKDSDLGNFGSALVTYSLDSDRGAWLLDSEATTT